MELALEPVGPPNLSIRETTDRLTQFPQAAPHSPWVAPAQNIFIQNYYSTHYNSYIDVEYPEVSSRINPPGIRSKSADSPPRRVTDLYQKLAEGRQPEQHAVDLFA